MAELPPPPPVPPIGGMRIVDEEGRATAQFAEWLAKLLHYLGHLTPPDPPARVERSTQTLAQWLQANVP